MIYYAIFFDTVSTFLKTLPENEQAKIKSHAHMMEQGDFRSVNIKTLKGQIKELKVRNYRLIFFIDKNILYFIGGFIKKSAKTPRKELQRAERLYKVITN